MSLRSQLVLATSAASTIILGLLGVAIYLSVQSTLYREFDGSLRTQAGALTAFTEYGKSGLKFDFDPQEMPEFLPREHPQFFELTLEGSGASVARAKSLQEKHLPDPRARFAEASHAWIVYELTMPNGRMGRAGTLRFHPRPEESNVSDEGPGATTANGEPSTETDSSSPAVYLTVARETAPLTRTLSRIEWLLAILCAMAVLLSAGILIMLVRRTMRPVTALSTRLATFRETDLAQRVDLPGVPAELQPVVQTLNDLLGRLDGAFTRERAFSADVAHELRTPLAGLQTTLEVCAVRLRDPAAYQAAVNRCLAVTHQMHALVDTLLLLARAEGGQLRLDPEDLDVREFLQECWTPFAATAKSKNLLVSWVFAPGLSVRADAERLRLILHNLFDNAVSYTPADGRITISAEPSSANLFVTVKNNGCSLSAEQLAHIFERFWRADAARSDTQLHCGLGLSLSQRLASVLQGSLSAKLEPPNVIAFVLVLPLRVSGADGQTSGTTVTASAPA